MHKHSNEKHIKNTFCIVETTTTTTEKCYQGIATNVTVKKEGGKLVCWFYHVNNRHGMKTCRKWIDRRS